MLGSGGGASRAGSTPRWRRYTRARAGSGIPRGGPRTWGSPTATPGVWWSFDRGPLVERVDGLGPVNRHQSPACGATHAPRWTTITCILVILKRIRSVRCRIRESLPPAAGAESIASSSSRRNPLGSFAQTSIRGAIRHRQLTLRWSMPPANGRTAPTLARVAKCGSNRLPSVKAWAIARWPRETRFPEAVGGLREVPRSMG